MSTGAVIAVVILVTYTVISAVFAFNVWRLSDRAAQSFVGRPWYIRAVGRDNPNSYRAFGAIGITFGLLTLGWIALQAIK
jgi:hypothetical protein